MADQWCIVRGKKQTFCGRPLWELEPSAPNVAFNYYHSPDYVARNKNEMCPACADAIVNLGAWHSSSAPVSRCVVRASRTWCGEVPTGSAFADMPAMLVWASGKGDGNEHLCEDCARAIDSYKPEHEKMQDYFNAAMQKEAVLLARSITDNTFRSELAKISRSVIQGAFEAQRADLDGRVAAFIAERADGMIEEIVRETMGKFMATTLRSIAGKKP